MEKQMDYKANLTGTAFLLTEFKKVIELQLQGLPNKEIKNKIKNENIFQYKYPSSINRIAPTIIRRADTLDHHLKQLFIDNYLEYGKVLNLYSIMKTDRLFKEFMFEIIKDKFDKEDYIIDKQDVNIYFAYKAEQHEKIARWTDKTMYKLRQVFFKILTESGLLKDLKSGEITRLLVDNTLKEYFINNDEAIYLKCMGVNT